MLIIADKRIPDEAKQNLSRYGDLLLLETDGVTEKSISGHPDVFICDVGSKLIVAPNTPSEIKLKLKERKIPFIEGDTVVGMSYPEAARYNAVVTDKLIFHRSDITDRRIINECVDRKIIHVNQGFTRCSLLSFDGEHFITSDEGIHKTLLEYGRITLKVSVGGIVLKGQPHGFFGGVCGIYGKKIFILGSLGHYRDKKKVELFTGLMNFEIVELYDGPLFDGGGIFFIETATA